MARLVIVAGLLALLIAAPAARADVVLTPVGGPGPLSAYGGHVVWNQPDPAGGYALMRWHAGQVQRLPVASGVAQFDVDLGPDADGRPVAVYSRCKRQPLPPPSAGPDAPPDRTLATGCDLYQLPLLGGRERKIHRVNTATANETVPTIWRGAIAFARTRRGSTTAAIYLLRHKARTLERLPGGQGRGDRKAVGAMDLARRSLIFTWTRSGNIELGYHASELWHVALPSKRRTSLTTGSVVEEASDNIISPNAGARDVLWARQINNTCFAQTRLESAGDRGRRQTPPTASVIQALARDGATVYAILRPPIGPACDQPSTYTLVRLDPASLP